MNYKIVLSAAFVAAVGLTGCDSTNTARDAESTNVDQTDGSVQSGATSPGTGNTGTTGAANAGQNSVGTSAAAGHQNAAGSSVPEKAESRDISNAREEAMEDRKISPDHAHRPKAKASSKQPVPAGSTSGSTSGSTTDSNDELIPDAGSDTNPKHSEDVAANDPSTSSDSGVAVDDDVYHSNDGMDDGSIASGSTTSADPEVSYSQTDHPGGIAPEDRNLRYGLIGNGTGMGLEDTTSKYMTDNQTLADPKFNDDDLVYAGALSAPTDDQDPLEDIRSGTTFDAEYYDIED